MLTTLFKRLFSFFIAFIVFANAMQAQKTVSGKVTDTDGNPLADVSVQVKGTKKLTATNRNGEYSIDALATDLLVFTSVGYANREVAINNLKAVDVILAQQNKALDEVVVVGYGTQKKEILQGRFPR
jgi:hypothetical protein